VVIRPEDHAVLGPDDFGMPGLVAIESIGPFTVHDSVVEAHLGIGHHPHRFNERLFFIEQGQLDHDDALNGITGHLDEGDVGLFTEGKRGMVHQEWNHGDVDTHAFILVYATDPVPERAAFDALRDAEAPRAEEPGGARTKELVGPTSRLALHGDVRYVAESVLPPGAKVTIDLDEGEGALVSVREGEVVLDGARLPRRTTVLWPPAAARKDQIRAETDARIVRVVHGPGAGFVTGEPMVRR
jgi:redox-sensitive bicupin YhaK (pirin superfamily)